MYLIWRGVGTPASASQMAKDVVTFLRWSAGECMIVHGVHACMSVVCARVCCVCMCVLCMHVCVCVVCMCVCCVCVLCMR